MILSRRRRISGRATAIIGHLESYARHYFGGPVVVEPLEEAPRVYSTVLRARVRMLPRPIGIYIKMYGADVEPLDEVRRYERYVRTEAERLRFGALHTETRLRVPRLIASLPDRRAVVTEEIDGRPLGRILQYLAVCRTVRSRAGAATALRHVGEWLHGWQASVPLVGRGAYDMRAYLQVRLDALVALRRPAFGERERDAALALFDAQAARMRGAEGALVAIHGDLCPSNIIVSGGDVGILDFSNSCDGPRYADLAHLLMHLELARDRLRLPDECTRALERALVEGFDPAFDGASPLFRLMLLQHVACRLKTLGSDRCPRTARGERQFRRAVARGFEIVEMRLDARTGPGVARAERDHCTL